MAAKLPGQKSPVGQERSLTNVWYRAIQTSSIQSNAMMSLSLRRKMLRQPERAHYVAMWRKARSYKVDMACRQWCDYSHQHFDWDGLGNNSWLDRRRHLAVLLHAFRRAQVELTSFEGEYQVFASIKPADSASDAVYVHTPNPNQTPYPMTPLGEEVLSLPPLLASRIDLSRYRVFRYGSGKNASFTILAARAALRLGSAPSGHEKPLNTGFLCRDEAPQAT